MNFDWSMVKGMRTSRDAPQHAPPPPEAPRFGIMDNDYPVSAEPGMSLLDFIIFCVPDDASPQLGAIGRLYDSLEEDCKTSAASRTFR